MKAKTKKQALDFGEKFYFTGKPCLHGNVSLRKSNGQCQCNDCKFKLRSVMKQWHKDNKESNLLVRKVWLKNNKEKVKQASLKWKENNHEKWLAYMNEWKEANKDKICLSHHKRRVAKIKGTPAWNSELDEFVMKEAAGLRLKRFELTGIEWQVDHMIPLRAKSVCGLHCADNLQVIPKTLNLQKRNRMVFTEPLEWIKYL